MGVEPATVDDVGAVADLWVALARDQRAYDSHVVPSDNRAAVREVVLRRVVADELLVARDGDEVVGFVSFTTETGQYEMDLTRGVVQDLFVVPDHRNRGLGTELLTAAERRLAASGVDAVTLEVLAANDDARRFYRRHGYDPHRVELEKLVESDTL